MGQIKALEITWLDEAWTIMIALQDMKEYPPGVGLLSPTPLTGATTKWKLPPATKPALETALQVLTLHLFYRLQVAHRVKMPTNIEGTRWFHDITDPTELLITWVYLRPKPKIGKPARDDTAFEAAYRLASVLKDRYCNPAWKREIPLLVAGAGGKSASEHARRIAAVPRGQASSRLADGLAVCVGRNPEARWKELLDDLTGDGIVTCWDHETVQWLDDDGASQETATGTFRNMITKAKGSKS